MIARRCVTRCTVWEECLVYLQQSFLIIHKEIKEVALVPGSKVKYLNAILGQLGKLEQRLFELLGFF